MRFPRSVLILGLALVGCGVSNGGGDGLVPETRAATTEPTIPDSACPVTIPDEPGFQPAVPDGVAYSEDFPEPQPYPTQYPHVGMVWYGSDELWTVLAVDGDHGGRKSVWWSANFPGGIEEEQPEVHVTWTRLDADEPVIDNGGDATNAYIPEEGWFMIAGIDPDRAGCWKVEATYKGATLSYVYERA